MRGSKQCMSDRLNCAISDVQHQLSSTSVSACVWHSLAVDVHLPVQLLALAGPPDVFGRIGGLQRSSCREVQSRFLLQMSAVGYQCPSVDALIFRRHPTLKTLSPWFASVMRRFGFAGLGLLPKFAVIRPSYDRYRYLFATFSSAHPVPVTVNIGRIVPE